jgi:hypothetical protein
MPNAPDHLIASFVFEADFLLGPRVALGRSSAGERRMVPILGGHFAGPSLRGKVLPGGADWQVLRDDGVLELDARYVLAIDDGSLIEVRNRALSVLASDKHQEPYVRCAPVFAAPSDGPHAWLNRTIFVGTLARADRTSVRVAVYKLL